MIEITIEAQPDLFKNAVFLLFEIQARPGVVPCVLFSLHAEADEPVESCRLKWPDFLRRQWEGRENHDDH
jgi:hypothetical protein